VSFDVRFSLVEGTSYATVCTLQLPAGLVRIKFDAPDAGHRRGHSSCQWRPRERQLLGQPVQLSGGRLVLQFRPAVTSLLIAANGAAGSRDITVSVTLQLLDAAVALSGRTLSFDGASSYSSSAGTQVTTRLNATASDSLLVVEPKLTYRSSYSLDVATT
jgi:hypothetical protein